MDSAREVLESTLDRAVGIVRMLVGIVRMLELRMLAHYTTIPRECHCSHVSAILSGVQKLFKVLSVSKISVQKALVRIFLFLLFTKTL